MTYFLPAEKTVVKRLSLRNATGDSGVARLRLSRLLDAASLSPHGLGPAAILCIRKLPDPLPGTLRLDHVEARPPLAWEQAAVKSLEQLARRAARPALGTVPAQAEAVLFADQAELLACLAIDWRAGLITDHWWWPSLFPRLDSARLILPAWLESPHYLPAALNQLAQMGQAVTVLSALNTTQARALTQHIMRCFALNELEMAIKQKTDSAKFESLSPAGGAAPTPPAAPWHACAPESESDQLGVEQQLLLGVGLTVHRAPALARSPAFARTAAEWLVTRPASETRTAVSTEESLTLTPANTSGVQAQAFAGPAAPISTKATSKAAQPEPSYQDSASQAEPITDPGLNTPVEIRPTRAGSSATPTEKIHSEQIPNFSPARTVDGTTTQVIENTATRQAGLAPEPISVPHTQQVETQFGGVFYFINLGLFLNLYGDFTTPAQPGLALSIWDFVALISRRLIGEAIEHDPVWELLAQLSGRDPDEPPGLNFEPPDEWDLPDEWLMLFPEATDTKHKTQDTRLKAQGLRTTLDFGPRTSDFTSDCWLDWLMPYLIARLQRAFGFDAADSLPDFVCKHPAQIQVTAERVDILLSLAGLPIEIRLAGLDRDPGWVPAAGRTIAFHFE